jgi:flagellar basal-body rod protein FlgC
VDFLKSIAIAASGLRAQAGRMRVISENVANADSTAPRPGVDPYRRKIPTFRAEMDRALDAQTVAMGRIRTDQSDFRTKYEPAIRPPTPTAT